MVSAPPTMDAAEARHARRELSVQLRARLRPALDAGERAGLPDERASKPPPCWLVRGEARFYNRRPQGPRHPNGGPGRGNRGDRQRFAQTPPPRPRAASRLSCLTRRHRSPFTTAACAYGRTDWPFRATRSAPACPAARNTPARNLRDSADRIAAPRRRASRTGRSSAAAPWSG